MPSILYKRRQRSDVRWSKSEECWEHWCPDCPKQHHPGRSWWPLDHEFWDKHNMARCRACNDKKSRDAIAKRRREDPAFKQRQVEQSRLIRGFKKEQ